MNQEALKQPTILVIFGVSGDLSRRYLLPALAEIAKLRQLPQQFKVLGVSRRDLQLNELLSEDQNELRQLVEIFQMDLADPASYQALSAKIVDLSEGFDESPQVIFYLSVPPVAVRQIAGHLGESGLNQGSKLMLEKPFGTDLESAKDLNERIGQYFQE